MKTFVATLVLACALSALAQPDAETYLSENASNPEWTDGVARLMHYLPEDLPIEVHIPRPEDSEGEALQAAARRAFEAWEAAAPEIADFEFVEASGGETLELRWQELESRVGSYRFVYSVRPDGLFRFRATQVILDPRYSAEEVYRYALLEVGHALGLLGRSPYPGDALSAVPSGEITPRDVATLRALYQLPSGTVLNR